MNETARKEIRFYLERALGGRFLADAPMAAHTWYRIGGPADFLVLPSSVSELAGLSRKCSSLGVDMFYLGEGANMLVADSGVRGVVVNLSRGMCGLSIDGNHVRAGAGVALRMVVYACECAGLKGMEALCGIPGTVGGALVMNAGTDQGEIGNRVVTVDTLGPQGTVVSIERTDVGFGYRSAPALQNVPVLGCTLLLEAGDRQELAQTRLEILRRRAAGQPLDCPSCGSVFKRPSGFYVGKMVEECGLKGFRHGDAMISDKHGGFIVNLGSARAEDIMWLIGKIREDILKRHGVALELEVRLLGF